MNKLRVGVWLNENYEAAAGGGFGYYHQLVNKLKSYNFKDAELVFLSIGNQVSTDSEKTHAIKWKPYKENANVNIIDFFVGKLRLKSRARLLKKQKMENDEELKKELSQYVDVIYYPLPVCAFPNFPYIYTLWDLGHLSMYAFPEVSMNNSYEIRKDHHDFYLYKALMIFAESNTGKKDIIRYLNINEERIKVVPLFPSEIVNDLILPRLPKNLDSKMFFIHYPSQYWSHKNHFNLLIALEILVTKFPLINLVLTGADKGNKEYIKQVVKEYNLDHCVIDLGFVSNEELKWLYLNSQGLVMPTFLGPTNMPLLEAAELNCPVACSNLEGHIEQLGDYGYYFNPKDPRDIANTICKMIDDKANNVTRAYRSNFNISHALRSIDTAFSELKHIRFCWGKSDKIY